METGRKKIFAFVLCMILSLSMAQAKPKDKEKEKHKGNGKESSAAYKAGGTDTRVAVGVFLGRDRDLIINHFRSYGGNLPPGLAKRGGNLPPGLEKQLRRNGHLPPGLEKKINPFPIELERQLPPLRPGLVRGIIGGSAVIMNSKTRVILDVFAIL